MGSQVVTHDLSAEVSVWPALSNQPHWKKVLFLSSAFVTLVQFAVAVGAVAAACLFPRICWCCSRVERERVNLKDDLRG